MTSSKRSTFSKPKIEFLDPPLVNEVIIAYKSVRNNTGLLKGGAFLSKIQERLTYSTFPLLDLMQKIRSDDQLTEEEILNSLEQSIVLFSSSYTSLSSVRRQRFCDVLAPEYASLVSYDSETPSKFLFGDNIADEVEKHSKERIIEKISKSSFQQSSHSMPNNQFRSGSNTFNQRTYKRQVHPKKRVVFKRNEDSKTKIQIKGQILKPPHRSNLFTFKKLEENNSKQISFRHCKRLQDSFCSETNPNLPSASPANRSRGEFTDKLRNLPSVREGSNRIGGYVSTSLLEQPFPCRQMFRGEEASYKSPTFKQICSK